MQGGGRIRSPAHRTDSRTNRLLEQCGDLALDWIHRPIITALRHATNSIDARRVELLRRR